MELNTINVYIPYLSDGIGYYFGCPEHATGENEMISASKLGGYTVSLHIGRNGVLDDKADSHVSGNRYKYDVRSMVLSS